MRVLRVAIRASRWYDVSMNETHDIPPRIREHLLALVSGSGLPEGQETIDAINENWIEKHKLFVAQIAALDMIELTELQPDDPRAALILTYSGSLVGLETEKNGKRNFEYASIKLRADVPDLVRETGVAVAGTIAKDAVASFSGGSVKSTSEVLILASFRPEIPVSDQDERLRQAILFLTNGFAKINRSLTRETAQLDHFTTKNIVQFISKRNKLTQAQVRSVVDDYLGMIEAGTLMGERVPLGRLGRLSLIPKKARQARVGRNPATGGEVIIPAKPAVMAPKFSVSRALKERAERLPVEDER